MLFCSFYCFESFKMQTQLGGEARALIVKAEGPGGKGGEIEVLFEVFPY